MKKINESPGVYSVNNRTTLLTVSLQKTAELRLKKNGSKEKLKKISDMQSFNKCIAFYLIALILCIVVQGSKENNRKICFRPKQMTYATHDQTKDKKRISISKYYFNAGTL